MSAVGGTERVEFPEAPKTEMELIHVPTSTGMVQDLHVVHELRGSEVRSEVVPPKRDLSRECAAAILALPPLAQIQNMVGSVANDRKVSEVGASSSTAEASVLESPTYNVNLESFEIASNSFKEQFEALETERESLQNKLNEEGVAPGKIDAFNRKVLDYNQEAGDFQQSFEATFIDSIDGGVYGEDLISPPDLKQCSIGDGIRHLSYKVSGEQHKSEGPVFIFQAGLGSPGSFDGSRISDAMKDDKCCWVTYDRAGTGRSPSRPDNSDGKKLIHQVEDDFDELLNHLEIEGVKLPVILVAHSLGAAYAQNYALKHPTRVAGIVLLDPISEREFDAKTPPPESNRSILKSPKAFIAVQYGVRGQLEPPKRGKVPDRAPEFMQSFSSQELKEEWWLSRIHQKSGDYFHHEQTHMAETANQLTEELASKGSHPYEDKPVLVVRRQVDLSRDKQGVKEEVEYANWRKEMSEQSTEGTLAEAPTEDHNIQFLKPRFLARQIRSKFLS